MFEAESGWVEAGASCDHLASLSSDLAHIPTPDTPCNRCDHQSENWLCLSCKDVLCSRYVNKHMLQHFQQTNHSVALSYSDLSVWCFICDAYLDAKVNSQLRPVYETAYILQFGKAAPFQSGCVEAQTSCVHLASLSSDLAHIPTPDTPCNRCDHPSENWLCLSCKDVLCSRYVNKHMLQHFH
ncbi:histone deacetylase 6 [Pistacia vera]|uniref:histone deacetylase 6 n=1 Tax=Pistacia vera TaxID=55513 RepID=UPI001263E685|nr:histone deacetylase 6 [Pistacia vera]